MTECLRLSEILDKSLYRRFTGPVQTNTIKLPREFLSTFKFKRKGKGDYIVPSSDPIKFEDFSSDELLEIWSRFSSSNFDEESLSYIRNPKLRYEILKTYYALTFWEDTPGEKMVTKKEILRDSLLLGPAYSKKISDMWDYGIRRCFRIPGTWLEFSEWDSVTQ